VLELDADLARIGLAGRPGLAAVHRAHSTAIPFENLDPHRGVPVSLAIEDIERKLVHQRRGGYCFEQNLLLAAALEALGAEIVDGANRVVDAGSELVAMLPTLERAIEMATPLEGALDRFGRLGDRLPGGATRRRLEQLEGED